MTRLMYYRACGAALLCTLTLARAHAQDGDRIATDRPDFVESSDVVGHGRFQIETGLSVERDTAGGQRIRTSSTPTLLRLGIGNDWELRAETDGRLAERVTAGAGPSLKQSGHADLSLGLKWHAQDGDGIRPSLALLGHLDLATGSAAWRGDGARPSLRMVAEWELSNGLSLGVMPGLVVDRNPNGERFIGGILGVVVGKSLNDRLRGFAELAASQVARGTDGGTVANLNLGAAYLLSPAWQLDIAYNKGLNHNTPDGAWNIGLSAKF